MRKFFKYFIMGVMLILTTLTPLFLAISCSPNSIVITEVHDGDTFTYGDDKHIRLFGVDTPEISDQYRHFAETTGIEHMYAVQARDFASNLVLNKEVEKELITTDDYGREVCKIKVGGKDLGLELVSHGLARLAYFSIIESDKYFSDDYSYFKEVTDAQYKAYYESVGVWSNKELFKTIFPKS